MINDLSREFKYFKKFWDSEVEKKLFRCSKEFGVYTQIKKVLNPKHKRYRETELLLIYTELFNNLWEHKYGVINFSDFDERTSLIDRKFTVSTAFHSKRHLSLLIIFRILEESHINETTFKNVCENIDRELFKKRKLSTFIIEKWYFIKLFFEKI